MSGPHPRIVPIEAAAGGDIPEHADAPIASDVSMGELIRAARGLSAPQVEAVLAHQRAHGLRFGEAAIALGFADPDDVLGALSQQFKYPRMPRDGSSAARAELVVATHPFGDDAEAFRDLRSQLLTGVFAGPMKRALAVLSPAVGEGRTYVAANIATALSQLGRRTLLIDADMRTPRQSQIFGIERPPGLSSVLSGRSEHGGISAVHDLSNLFVLAAGPVPPNPVELLERPAFALLILDMLERFDHVVIDTPAGSHGTDARIIAAKAGAALVVGRTGHSRIPALQALLASLETGPARLAGILMNGR